MDVLEVVERLVVPRWKTIAHLGKQFIRLEACGFRSDVEKLQAKEIALLCLALTALSAVLVFAGIEVDPAIRPADIRETALETVASAPLLWVAGIAPMYFALRAFGGQRVFRFLLIGNSVASVFAGALMWLTVVPSTFLAPQLDQDLYQIKHSAGKSTEFYKDNCARIDRQIQILSDKLEREKITGYYSLMVQVEYSKLANAKKVAAIEAYNAHLHALPPQLQSREKFLAQEIDGLEAHSDPLPSDAQWWVYMSGNALYLLFDIALGIFSVAFLWKGVSALHPGPHWPTAVRICIGFLGTLVLTTFAIFLRDEVWPWRYYDLNGQTHYVRDMARSAALQCGSFDSKGMW